MFNSWLFGVSELLAFDLPNIESQRFARLIELMFGNQVLSVPSRKDVVHRIRQTTAQIFELVIFDASHEWCRRGIAASHRLPFHMLTFSIVAFALLDVLEACLVAVNDRNRVIDLTDPELEIGRMTRKLMYWKTSSVSQRVDQWLGDVFDVGHKELWPQ